MKLGSAKLIKKFNALNKKIYKDMISEISKLPATVQQCSQSICCTDVKVNVDVVETELSLIVKLYNLTVQIKNNLPKAKPGGVCHGTGCAQRQVAGQSLIKWLTSQAKRLKAGETKAANQIPVLATQCSK